MTTNPSDAVDARDAFRVPDRVASWAISLAPFALALVAYVAAYAVMSPETSGDEPHYLIAAQSLAFDGDLNLTNDYFSRERVERATVVFPLPPHAIDYRDTGELRPVRGIGMAALLAPAAAIGQTAARLLMVLIAALLADQLFRLLRDLGFRRRFQVLAWVAVAFCYPLLAFSSQIYPELPGALLVVFALRVMVRWPTSPGALALASAGAASLVWLQVRFIPLSAGLFAGLLVAAYRAGRPPGATGLRSFARFLRASWRTATAPVVIPYAAWLAVFGGVSYHLYASVNPTAPYDPYADESAGSGGWAFLYDFALPDLFNPVHGWIPYVPVHWLGLAALGCLVLRWRWIAAACIAVPVVYELLVASAGIDLGWGLPARYLIVVIPLVAVPLALAIQEVRASLFAFAPLLAVSLVFSAAAVANHHGLFPADDKSRILGARATSVLFPVTNPDHFAFGISYLVPPGRFGPVTGGLENGVAVARAGDDPGALSYGPYQVLRRGTYRATFRLAAVDAAPSATVVAVDAVSAPPPKVLAARSLAAGELSGRMSDVTLEFSNPEGGVIETRVHYAGEGTVRAGPVRVDPVDVDVEAPGRVPDWPKALAWVLGTIAAGWLLVLGMKRGGRRSAT
jgi:hypothetical protein